LHGHELVEVFVNVVGQVGEVVFVDRQGHDAGREQTLD
jgi:hypothetical protein